MSFIIDSPSLEKLYRYDYTPAQSGPFEEGPFIARRVKKEWSPVLTPNFGKAYQERSKVRLPMNDYSLFKENVNFPRGNKHLVLTYLPNGHHSDYYGVAQYGFGDCTYLEPTGAARDATYARLRTKCLEKIKGQTVNLGNFIAEREQALKMFGDTAGKLAKAYRQVRRKEFKKAFETLGCKPSNRLSGKQSAANNWLQLQYGWLPFIEDVYGVAQELEKAWDHVPDKLPLNTAVAKSRLHDSDKQLDTSSVPANLSDKFAIREYIHEMRLVVHYTVDYQASQFLGRVGLTNPASIAWEVTPYSFVVDWFLPIGRFLNTLDATLGCTFVDSTRAETLWSHLAYQRKGLYTGYPFSYLWNMPLPINGKGAHGRYFYYQRIKLVSFPTVALPQFKSPLSAKHLANSLALLTQSFSR